MSVWSHALGAIQVQTNISVYPEKNKDFESKSAADKADIIQMLNNECVTNALSKLPEIKGDEGKLQMSVIHSDMYNFTYREGPEDENGYPIYQDYVITVFGDLRNLESWTLEEELNSLLDVLAEKIRIRNVCICINGEPMDVNVERLEEIYFDSFEEDDDVDF